MLGSRFVRFAAALFVLSAVGTILWPQATGYVSKFAVINAPVLTVRAPMNGVISIPTPGLAAAVQRDQIMLEIQGRNAAKSEAVRTSALVLAKSEQAAALQDEEANLHRVLARLRTRAVAESDSEIEFLSLKLNELRAIRRRTATQWDQAHEVLTRLNDLFERGRVPKSELLDAKFLVRELDAQLSADDARIDAMEVELTTLSANLPSPAGTGRRDFGYDRIDDMSLALADIQTRRRTVEGERDAAISVLRSIQEDQQSGAVFQPLASTNGVIWTASRQSGASVTDGSDLFQILDCERRFLEVVFDEKAFENLPAGTEATVLLRGALNAFSATVVSRHAAGGGTAVSAVDAAVATTRDKHGVTVFLRLDSADITDPSVAAAFCDVGRTAEVQIRDPRFVGLFDQLQATWSQLINGSSTLLAKATGF